MNTEIDTKSTFLDAWPNPRTDILLKTFVLTYCKSTLYNNHPFYQLSKLVLLNLPLSNVGGRTQLDFPEPNIKAEQSWADLWQSDFWPLCCCEWAVSVVALVQAGLSGILKPGPPCAASSCLGSGVLLYPGQLIFMTWAWPSLAVTRGGIECWLLSSSSPDLSHTHTNIKQLRLFR